jgi:hypothetical protein
LVKIEQTYSELVKIAQTYSELVKIAQKYLAWNMKTHVRVIVVANINFILFVQHSVTCGSTKHTDHVVAYQVEQ